MKRKNLLPFSCLLLLLGLYTAARAAEKAPFYQGKIITLIINFATGGTTAIEGRVIAKHLTKHIPGNPTCASISQGSASSPASEA